VAYKYHSYPWLSSLAIATDDFPNPLGVEVLIIVLFVDRNLLLVLEDPPQSFGSLNTPNMANISTHTHKERSGNIARNYAKNSRAQKADVQISYLFQS
jgi:hypothetical protein